MAIRTTKIKKNYFYKKKVLVTGGTGLIGVQLLKLLVNLGAKVTSCSLDKIKPIKNVSYITSDLREFKNCLKICKSKDIVFHLAGIKGSPKMSKEMPSKFFVPTIQFSLNMMEAARRSKVKDYLFTSSVGVYAPNKILNEEDVWKTFPSDNDKFPGWAKRICELQAECYKSEKKWSNIFVVRPANVYGPYDNFDTKNAMVIPSLIKKALETKTNYLEVLGNGKPIRDFIFSRDVAKGMLKVVSKRFKDPINLGSGKGYPIKYVAEIVAKSVPNGPLKIKWKKTKSAGDKKRILGNKLQKKINFKIQTSLEDGIKETINWFVNNKKTYRARFNSFLED